MKNILIDWFDAVRLRDKIQSDPYFTDCVYGITRDNWKAIRADAEASICDPMPFMSFNGDIIYLYSLNACGLSLFIPSVFISDEALEDYEKRTLFDLDDDQRKTT